MAHGLWLMAHGSWRMAHGSWLMIEHYWYMGHTYRGAKSGCKLLTLFDSYSYDGVSAGIWVIHTGPKSWGHAFWRLLCFCWRFRGAGGGGGCLDVSAGCACLLSVRRRHE